MISSSMIGLPTSQACRVLDCNGLTFQLPCKKRIENISFQFKQWKGNIVSDKGSS